jgi:uncharacterized protein
MLQESYMRKIVALVGVMAIVALGAYTYSTVKQSRYMYSGPTSISVVGVGEVVAKPDIATFTFSVESKETDAVTAQNKVNETMTALMTYLKEAGVEEKDIKTQNYSLYPQYEYPQVTCTAWGCPPAGEPKIVGYQVSQQVTVKVRATEKAGELVSNVGSKGAMNVSGLTFTIDDEEALKAQARELAIKDGKEKAKTLAGNLGTRLGRLTGFWEDQSNAYPMPYGMGGMEMMKSVSMDAATSAELPMGENTVKVTVNMTYEIKSHR